MCYNVNYFVSQPVGLDFASGFGYENPMGQTDYLLYHVIHTQPWHNILPPSIIIVLITLQYYLQICLFKNFIHVIKQCEWKEVLKYNVFVVYILLVLKYLHMSTILINQVHLQTTILTLQLQHSQPFATFSNPKLQFSQPFFCMFLK